MSPTPEAVEEILAKLAKDIESAVHSMYRGQVGPNTAQVRTEHFVADARERISAFMKSSPSAHVPGAPPQRFTAAVAASSVAGDGGNAVWTPEEAAAITKCLMAWLPLGSPSSAAPDSRCMPSGKELLPTWGDREMARAAVRKVSVKQ
jgi:hypothetical protein